MYEESRRVAESIVGFPLAFSRLIFFKLEFPSPSGRGAGGEGDPNYFRYCFSLL